MFGCNSRITPNVRKREPPRLKLQSGGVGLVATQESVEAEIGADDDSVRINGCCRRKIARFLSWRSCTISSVEKLYGF